MIRPLLPVIAEHQNLLLQVAMDSVKSGLRQARALWVEAKEYPPELQLPRAVFVTLTVDKELRGCIGTLESGLPLVVNVAKYAHAAAFSDPRFDPLTEAELPQLDIHISVLSELEPIPCRSEAELLSHLQPGIDGLLLEAGGRRGTLLPSVWQSIPHPAEFLRQLKRKAGLPPDFWSDQVSVQRYSAFCFP
jgi:AmmeMemoRadiSam system protein A